MVGDGEYVEVNNDDMYPHEVDEAEYDEDDDEDYDDDEDDDDEAVLHYTE